MNNVLRAIITRTLLFLFFFVVRQEEIPEDDDTIDYLEKENMYVCEMDIASAFYGALIGKNAENKQKLEQDTNTQIIFPRRDETGTVKIRGRTKANVQSARTRMEIIIDRSRQMQQIHPFSFYSNLSIIIINKS